MIEGREFTDISLITDAISIADAYEPAPIDCSLSSFRPLTVSDVVTAVRALPEKFVH